MLTHTTSSAYAPCRVELDTVGARGSIKFDVAPMGFGQAIVTVAVSGGSEAEEVRGTAQRAAELLCCAKLLGCGKLCTGIGSSRVAPNCAGRTTLPHSSEQRTCRVACPQAGVRRGMRLTAISDPIRRNEVWKLQDRPSLKNIRELLRMRSADTITLEFVPWDGPLPGGVDGDSIPTSSAGSAMGSALSSVDGSSLSSGESIGDRLARQYREAAATGRSPTAVQQRQQRRRERMELDARRDDRPFLLGVLALFVLPPLVILVVSWHSARCARADAHQPGPGMRMTLARSVALARSVSLESAFA